MDVLMNTANEEKTRRSLVIVFIMFTMAVGLNQATRYRHRKHRYRHRCRLSHHSNTKREALRGMMHTINVGGERSGSIIINRSENEERIKNKDE